MAKIRIKVVALWVSIIGAAFLVVAVFAIRSVQTSIQEKADRAGCIINIRNVQEAVRGHAGYANLGIGEDLDSSSLIDYLVKLPTCPSGGTYTYLKFVPEPGVLYCTCSHAKEKQHEPPHPVSW